jgi:hypothetical protein
MKSDEIEAKEPSEEGSPEQEDPNNEQQESEDEEDYEMKFPSKYHNNTDPEYTTVQEQIVGNDGKIQRTFINGKKEVIFSNGVRRETNPDGYTIVYFNNNDIK